MQVEAKRSQDKSAYVVYAGDQQMIISDGIVMPWNEIEQMLQKIYK